MFWGGKGGIISVYFQRRFTEWSNGALTRLIQPEGSRRICISFNLRKCLGVTKKKLINCEEGRSSRAVVASGCEY